MPRVRTGASTRMTLAADDDDLVLVDLSHAGCAVQARHAFSPGDELHVTFTVDTCLSFIVPVRTVYARRTSHGHAPGFAHLIGFEFVTARQPDIHRIVEILLEAMEEPLSVH
jgi:hypothetical protein